MVRMSERQQIVLLICEVGGYVCLRVCVFGAAEEGGSHKKNIKKTLSLTSDDIFGSTSKASQGRREREVYRRQIGCRFYLLCSRRKFVHRCVCVCVCVCVCGGGGGGCGGFFFFSLSPQTEINNFIVPPEVLNSGVQREEKNTISLSK